MHSAPAPTVQKKIRVLVADDHDRLRTSLVECLNEQPDMEVVGEAADGQVAVEVALATHPDVVVMDVSMPHCNGIAATRGMREELPDVKVVGLSVYAGPAIEEMMREAGASAYVPKGADIENLVDAIRDVVHGPELAS